MAIGLMKINGPKEKITRSCLKCGKDFTAEGKFNRICPKCDKKNERLTGCKCKAMRSSRKTRSD